VQQTLEDPSITAPFLQRCSGLCSAVEGCASERRGLWKAMVACGSPRGGILQGLASTLANEQPGMDPWVISPKLPLIRPWLFSNGRRPLQSRCLRLVVSSVLLSPRDLGACRLTGALARQTSGQAFGGRSLLLSPP
jgi:hypothetical protein